MGRVLREGMLVLGAVILALGLLRPGRGDPAATATAAADRLAIRTPGGELLLGWTHDGSGLATARPGDSNPPGRMGGFVVVRDAADGRERAAWGVPSVAGLRLAIAPDGRARGAVYLAGPNHTGPNRASLFDAEGRERASFEAGPGWFRWVGFRDGGRTLRVVVGEPGHLFVSDVDAASGAISGPRPVVTGEPGSAIAVAPDGGTVAVVPARPARLVPGQVKLVPLDGDRPPLVLDRRPSGSIPISLALSPGAATLAVGSVDGTVEFWDVAEETLRWRSAASSDGHAVAAIEFDPGGDRLAAMVQVYHPGTLDWVHHALRNATGLDLWKPRPRLVVLEAADGRVVDRSAGLFRWAFSPEGRSLAAMHVDGSIRLRAVGPGADGAGPADRPQRR